MKPHVYVYFLIHIITTTMNPISCQSGFYPEFLTEREALALLSSDDEVSPMPTTTTTMRPSDASTKSAASTTSETVVPGSHRDLGHPRDPGHLTKDSYDFSISHHQKIDPVNQKKFYDVTGSMDHVKQEEKAANEPKSQHHSDTGGHENHQTQHHDNHQHHHDHHHHSQDKKEKEQKHHDHNHHQSEKDHKHGHGEHHKHHHHKDEKTQGEHHHNHEQKQHQPQHQHHEGEGEKRGKDVYYRRPQYDEVIEPHQVLVEPQLYPQHADPEAHMYYKNTGYDYGAAVGGAGGEMAYRSDFYWLIPLVIIIGIGALLLPMLSLFMTIMVSQGAITLTGRRKRSFMNEPSPISSESIIGLISLVESAITKFNNRSQKGTN